MDELDSFMLELSDLHNKFPNIEKNYDVFVIEKNKSLSELLKGR